MEFIHFYYLRPTFCLVIKNKQISTPNYSDKITMSNFFFHWVDLQIDIVYLLLNLYSYTFSHIHIVWHYLFLEWYYSNQLLCCLYLSVNQQSNTCYLSKVISLNSFSEANIFPNIIFSSHVITIFIHWCLLLKTIADEIYYHL